MAQTTRQARLVSKQRLPQRTFVFQGYPDGATFMAQVTEKAVSDLGMPREQCGPYSFFDKTTVAGGIEIETLIITTDDERVLKCYAASPIGSIHTLAFDDGKHGPGFCRGTKTGDFDLIE